VKSEQIASFFLKKFQKQLQHCNNCNNRQVPVDAFLPEKCIDDEEFWDKNLELS